MKGEKVDEEDSSVGKPVEGPQGLAIVEKHPLAIRWFHWLNFPILFTMIWSGILIYWAASQPGQDAGHFYRIGFGDHTLVRLFPDWFYRPEIHGLSVKASPVGGHPLWEMNSRLAEGMAWHFLFMWFFTINGIAYVLFTIFSGQWRYLVPNRHSFAEAIQVVLFDLHIRKEPLPSRKYNGAQQIAYTSVIVMGIGSFVTGLAVYKPSQLSWPVVLGGYTVARFLHFWLMMGFVGFFVIHIIQVIRAGWNNFRGMLTGRELAPVSYSNFPEPLPPTPSSSRHEHPARGGGSEAEGEPA